MVRRGRGDDGQRGYERRDDFGRGGLDVHSVCSRRRQRALASRILNGQGRPCRHDGSVRGRHRPIHSDHHGDAKDLHQRSVWKVLVGSAMDQWTRREQTIPAIQCCASSCCQHLPVRTANVRIGRRECPENIEWQKLGGFMGGYVSTGQRSCFA